MLQLLPQSNVFTPKTTNPIDAVENINSYIESSHYNDISIDVSFMNIIDACYVSTICSTNHYIKCPDGKINWIISSERTEEFTKSLNLGNSTFIVNK